MRYQVILHVVHAHLSPIQNTLLWCRVGTFENKGNVGCQPSHSWDVRKYVISPCGPKHSSLGPVHNLY